MSIREPLAISVTKACVQFCYFITLHQVSSLRVVWCAPGIVAVAVYPNIVRPL